MGEQSPAVAMFRAFVVMVCPVVIALAALFGTSLPDAIKAIKEGHWPTLASVWPGSAPAKAPTAADEPAKFEPAAGAVASHATATIAPPAPTTVPARTPPPVEPPPLAASWPADATRGGAAGVVPARFETPADPRSQPAGRPSPAAQAAASDPFTAAQTRLRQLGATYYLLESLPAWGGQPQQYRFFCKVAVGGNPNFPQRFEATEAEPLRAMSQVLQQVEIWAARER